MVKGVSSHFRILETSSSLSATMNLITMSPWMMVMMVMGHLVECVTHVPLTEHDLDIIKNDVYGDDLINVDSDDNDDYVCVLTTRNKGRNQSGLPHIRH